MLTGKQLEEIRDHLNNSQNPVFFYDNDADGLCSYVLLRKYIGRGKGVAIRTHPDINVNYVRKVQEFKADCVFVLDKPVLGKEFVEEINKMSVPIVWIDHHNAGEDYNEVFVYDSSKNIKDNEISEPVTYLCYKVTERKEDLWIAMMGCIADNFMPDFVDVFSERWSEFYGENLKVPFDVYYKTEIGLLARSLAFGLKDSITHIVELQNFLIKSNSPGEMKSELDSYSAFGKKYRELKKKYDSLILKAKDFVDDKILFFSYGGDMSMSSEISNELCYLFPNKIIAVGYDNGGMVNISLRGDNVREKLEKVLVNFEGATGGGHRNAVGSRIKSSDLELFKEKLKELL